MMKFPVHPGELLREEVIAALQLSVTDAAERLGMSRVALSRVLNGRAGVSTARAWLAMQSNYDLAQAMEREQPPVRPLDYRAA